MSGLARDQDFVQERKLKPNAKKCKCVTWETCASKVVQLERSTDGGMGTGPPAAGGYGGLGAKPPANWRCFVIKKKSCFNAIGSHFARAQSHL